MLKQRHWKMSLKQLRSLRHPLRLLVLASAILFIHFNAHAAPQADFSLSVNPSSLTINPGASATATVTISRSGGFTGAVTLSAFEAVPTIVLPSGINITFNPASTTGNSSVATITVPSTFPPGAIGVTITGNGGGLTHITSLTINVPGLTLTAEVTENGPFFNQEQVRLSHSAPITSLSVTIFIQRTPGLSVNGQFNTMGSQMTQSVTVTPTAFVYQFNLIPGQTLQPEPNRVCAAQTSGSGTTHPTSGDNATITYTIGGVSHTETRTF
jgi:endoglucanase